MSDNAATQRTTIAIVSGGIIGLLAFSRAVHFPIVNPSLVDWIYYGGVDPSQHFTGWHMFRSEPWGFPPGVVRSFGHPVGTSIALTDSIPLVAIPLKVVSVLLPAVFQYLGLWALSCFVLQGAFGALLLGTITRRLALQIIGATLLVLSPAIVHSFGQAALMAQWQLLAGLWLYFSRDANASFRHTFAAWIVLVMIAAATHPYLTAMVLALAIAAMARHALQSSFRAIARAVSATVVLPLVALLVWWLTGYFVVTDRGDLQLAGFGILSLNLVAPLVPPPGSILFGRIPLVVTEAQRAGSSYLGMGVIALAAVAIVLVRPRSVDFQKLYLNVPLIVVCIVLTLLALSPTVTFGVKTVVEYDPRWWGPFSVFRVSARMFWPGYYAIVFGVLAVVIKRLTFVPAVAVLLVATFLQTADLNGIYRITRAATAQRVTEPLPSEFWKVVPRYYKHMVLNPTNICPSPHGALDYRMFALRAGPAGTTINAGAAARGDMVKLREYCRTYAADMQQGRVADDTLYVLVRPLMSELQAVAQKLLVCTEVDGYAVCVTADSYRQWQDEFDIGPR